jgi:hypothetical protein
MINDSIVQNVYHAENDTLCVDTFMHVINDDTTIVVERQAKEIQIIEKLIERPDLGKNVFITLVFIFVLIAIIKRRKNG